jgi:hypothetical protein
MGNGVQKGLTAKESDAGVWTDTSHYWQSRTNKTPIQKIPLLDHQVQLNSGHMK